ncbi:MAG: chromosome segregation protein SMC [Ignavibacteriales bacterium]|nr:chromosome segregation protein SMC [Ignavibacteriales bacterium]
MYLSKLDIFGFKSFAQKVGLTFDAGMTSIVGPNGCGKTNVVDAIRWALGEQRPTTLRSDKMEDVIFNGTKSRKPLSMAEVSITIENTKGILPTEYSEVTITRRVYRSGEGEYFLNKTLCRLKDIRDLFMDTGMGSDAYSVIELKMVESILSDSSDERRRLFEESAGVTKYKHRRREAYRRLDTVRVDLTRVNDIVREVQKAVNSLERQAQKAQRYNEFVKTLSEKEIDLLSREYASVVSKISPLKDQLAQAVTKKNRVDVEVKQEETLLEVLRKEMEELEDQLTAAQSDLSSQQSRIHEFEQRLATSRERRRSLTANIERFEQEKVELLRHQKELRLKQGGMTEELRTVKKKVVEAEQVYGVKKSGLDELDKQVNAKKSGLKSHQDQVIALLHEISELRQKESQAKARIENIRGRISYTSEESEQYRRDIAGNEELISQMTAEDRELRRRFAEAEVRVHQMEDYKQKLQKDIEHLRHQDMDLRGEIERKQARVDFLKSLVESFDGYSEGARYLITSSEWGSRIQTPVGDALTTDSRHRVAVETALGDAAGYVVVESVEQAYAAMDFLKQSQKGKATFICLDRLPMIHNHRPRVTEDGVVGWVMDVVRFDERYDRLFGFLFDETLIVQNVRVANEIVTKEPNIRCVTVEGEIVTGKGVVRGGSMRQDEGGHIGKKSQLDELAEDLKKLAAQKEKVLKEIERRSEELEGINLRSLVDEAREIEQAKTSIEVRIAQLEFEKKRAQESIERNQAEAERQQQEVVSLAGDLETLTPAIAQHERQKAEAEQQVGVSSSALASMEALWNEHAKIATDAHLQALALKSEERSVQQSIEHAESTLVSIASNLDQRTQEVGSAKVEIRTIADGIGEAEVALLAAKKEFEALLERKKAVDSEFVTKRANIHEIELKLKDERLKQEGSLQAAHDLEFKIQELSMKSENLKTRAKDEFEIELELKEYTDEEQFDFNAAREEIREKKERIRNLGNINFAAFEEYKSEKERLDFVAAQRDDLEESEKTLLATIDEINTTAQKLFLTTFEKIRDNFIMIFKELFDEGDECDLTLEKDVDPLEARIEITAKPRGKRPTSIDLLSGGEKTLTAIALLFAIYLVKPSPFCILDEVDAPLDDSNIDRFTRILKKFSDNTQFVVVTHNKRTMESANALYGVTMEEEGVSKLVSVRLMEPVGKE